MRKNYKEVKKNIQRNLSGISDEDCYTKFRFQYLIGKLKKLKFFNLKSCVKLHSSKLIAGNRLVINCCIIVSLDLQLGRERGSKTT